MLERLVTAKSSPFFQHFALMRLGPLPEKAIHHLDGGGDKATSKAVVTNFLKSRPQKNILIVGINDESAIGAVQAADLARAAAEVAIVGHGGSTEIMKLIVDPKSPCIGTISFHAELYGTDLLHFALPLAQGRYIRCPETILKVVLVAILCS